MVYSEGIATLIHLINNPPPEAVEQASLDGLWDHATQLWATEREELIRQAVKALRDILVEHEAAIGLLALYIVENKICQSSGAFPWLRDFNGALQRIADDLVPAGTPPWASTS